MLIHGFVFDDANGDGRPQAAEHGVANAVVALGVEQFVTTDARGYFEIKVSEDRTVDSSIVWVRVPDGFRPGPVWAAWDPKADHELDLALHRLAEPVRGPLTFVVAADTHLPADQASSGAADLAAVAREATALDPPPAFFTILGDITQGGSDAELALVDRALAGLDVPYIPVPGNHDWYDGGDAWFRHYGPDNYSFDLAGVHFVVWNMAMTEDDIRAYLGAELSRVAKGMPIVALTHAPPSPGVVDALRDLGVDYVLTGHAHSNRPTDHGGVIELNTEPMLMGGLDFTPAGYRVVTISGGKLESVHRTTVDEPQLHAALPACVPAHGGELLAAAELDAGGAAVTARVDCATPVALSFAGGWTWRAPLPVLAPGRHEVAIEAASPTGTRATTAAAFAVCEPGAAPATGEDWPQVGGGAAHLGARDRELAPPLATRWIAAAGGHVVTAPPAIAHGIVYVATTDLGDGGAGGVVALDLATGAVRWRVTTPVPVRGGVAAIDAGIVAVGQIDGIVLGLDASTGAERWRYALAPDQQPTARALFGSPTADGGDVLVGHQREVAALAGATGTPLWSDDPVRLGEDSQSLAAIAVGSGIAVGTFNRRYGGMIAWDRSTGFEQWRHEGLDVVAVNASPVIAGDTVYVVSGADDVSALDLFTGDTRWTTRLDAAGFAWGNATVGTPALWTGDTPAHGASVTRGTRGVLVVPTLYGALVALDAATGAELWRSGAAPGPLRTTHYRGAGESGFAASPVITGGIVWAADTAGELVARSVATGDELWRANLEVPVLAGLAVSGDSLVVASYDGTVRVLAPGTPPDLDAPATCAEPAPAAGCCDASGGAPTSLVVAGALATMLSRRRRR